MDRPELKQFCDLTEHDFDRHPVWIACHSADYDEPWYDDMDEETFRPWTGTLPADPSAGMLLVRASIELRDKSVLNGFMTPSFERDELGTQQPQVFAGGRIFGFWGGMFGVPAGEREALYQALGKTAAEVFPLRFRVDPSLASGATTGIVEGFYKRSDNGVEIER